MSSKINGITQEQTQREERQSLISKISTLEEKMQSSKDENEQLRQNFNNLADEFNQKVSMIATLENQVRELEVDVQIERKGCNKAIDVFLQAESRIKELQEERDGYKNGQIQLQGMVNDLMDVNSKWAKRVEKLEEAVDRHEIFKRTHEKIVTLEDEALYQARKEE